MNWALLGGSLAGVLGLSGLAWLLGLGKSIPLTRPEAMAAAIDRDAARPPVRAYLSDDGRAALVVGADRRIALIRRNGAQSVVRHVVPPVKIEETEDALILDLGERMFGSTRLTLEPQAREELLTILSVRG